jgi:hypothetical protein
MIAVFVCDEIDELRRFSEWILRGEGGLVDARTRFVDGGVVLDSSGKTCPRCARWSEIRTVRCCASKWWVTLTAAMKERSNLAVV